MKRTAFATITLLALSPAAFAQTPAAVTPTPAIVTPAVTLPAPAVMFASIPTGDDLSSNLLGLEIYNGNNQSIGTVKDIAMSGDRVNAYIVGVGGFLGIGDYYVAIKPAAIAISYSVTDKKWHATMNTDAAALKAAPQYKYAS